MMSVTQVLVWSAILTWVMLLTASLLRSEAWTSQGMEVALGNRDDLPAPTQVAGRADRAAKNMLENLVLFVAAAAVVLVTGRASHLAQLGANIFFWSRVAYWPCYLAGIIYLRTALWAAGIVGLAMMVAAVW